MDGQYGFCLNTLHSFEFEGSAGMLRMQEIMETFRKGLCEIAEKKVLRTEDYVFGLNGLPPADVLKFFTQTSSVVIQPSGTEPKLEVEDKYQCDCQ